MDKLMELKTSDALLTAIDHAVAKKQTASDIREQRVSFIYGSIHKEDKGVTRSRIQEVLAEQQGIGS